MDHNKAVRKQRKRRSFRVRKRLSGTPECPRLTVSKSHKHVYCQLIDDVTGKTIASASTRDKDLRGEIKNGGNKEAAIAVGKAVAEKASAAGVKSICFDRGPYKYHGRVAALADAVREAGISL
jgi:large subunit ribosomal protein L18